ncbi:MAG TPA: MFS transporter [Candidatus Acidoferrum sp.]|nr:MFS transporter [Candidatus Acidoferrum sp.]
MSLAAPTPASGPTGPAWLRLFAPAPAAPIVLTEPAAIERSCRAWQRRVLFFTIAGYTAFYFVRKNLSVAMPFMEHDLGLSKAGLGLFLTLHGILYGISKFANGFFGDRCNARVFMVVGLAASAVLNVFFGLGSAVVLMGVVWMLNGWFQGMGFPPCARLLTHWFPPRTFARKMAVWNISHSLGAGLILLLCGYVLVRINWRMCFLVPAGIAFLCAIMLWFNLPDTPPSVGLPEIEGTHLAEPAPETTGDFMKLLGQAVFRNKFIWLVSVANFFVYILRYAVLDWGPTMLMQAKHLSIGNASLMVAGFEAAGVVGALLAGWFTDRWFAGRPMRVGVFYMIAATVSLLLFWKAAGNSRLWNTLLLCASGFFIYGPQCLIGITAAKLATKRAAATAVGLTGFFGYLSTVLSGWGLGALVEWRGWDAGLLALIVVAVIGILFFIAAWPAKADGYEHKVA